MSHWPMENEETSKVVLFLLYKGHNIVTLTLKVRLHPTARAEIFDGFGQDNSNRNHW